MTKKDLERTIKARDAGGVYFIYGTDAYTVGELAHALRDSVVSPDERTFNLHEYQAKEMDIDEVIGSCEALPMFAERVCVTVCDLDLETLRISDKLKPLYKEIEELPDTTVLIFYTDAADLCAGKKKPTDKNKRMLDKIAKSGNVIVCDKMTPGEAAREIEARVRENGGSITRSAASLIYTRCVSDLRTAMNEADKLCAYTDSITEADVAALTPEQDDTKVYALTDAIAAGDRERAVSCFGKLMESRTDPIYLLYIITGSINDIYRAKLAQLGGRTKADYMNDCGIPKVFAFKADNAFSAASRADISRLRRAMKILSDTDIAVKSGAMPDIAIEEAIIKIM
jgi:DNA polymerase-3 subunit delta